MTVGHRSLRGSARRGLAVMAASAMMLATLVTPALGAQENTEYLEAADNVGAALAWSQFAFADGAATAVALGRDDVFADSLSSGLIQGLGDGVPLLLTDTDELDDAVAAEIERLGATTVHILGGTTAISEAVEAELEGMGLTIHRHDGATRVETSIDIATDHGGAATTAIVARAYASSADETQAFADSLAAGAWSAEDGYPILLTQTNELHEEVEDYLAASNITNVFVVGGTAAVSDAVVSAIEALGITVTRVAGSNRFETAIEVAEARGFNSAADADNGIVVLEGQDANAWASGFAAAAYAANPKPIVLVNGDMVPASTQAWLAGGNANLIVCGPIANATACDAVSAAVGNDELLEGNATFLDVPELVSVEFAGGDDDDDERVVVFTFDENLEENAVSGSQFLLYTYDGQAITGGDTEEDDNQVAVVFDYSLAEFATVGAVQQGAVQDEDGNENVEGSAPLRSVSLASDRTQGPDLVDVEIDEDTAEVTFVFDEDVDTDGAANSNYVLVLVDGADAGDEPELDNSGTVTEVDGDEVVVDFGASLNEDDVIRAYIEEGAAQDEEDGGAVEAAPHAYDLSGDLERAPRLLSATVSLSDDTDDDDDPDTITYRFSEAVAEVSDGEADAGFFAVLADGTVVDGTGFALTAGDTDEGTRIEIEFPEGALDETVSRVGIYDQAVESADDGDDSTGIQTAGVNPSSFDAGETTGPDPVSMEVVEDLDAFGNVDALQVRITFDEPIDDDNLTAANIVAYEEDGDESDDLSFTDADCEEDDDNVLVCDIDDVDDADDVVVIALQAGVIQDFDGNSNYEVAFGFEAPGDEA